MHALRIFIATLAGGAAVFAALLTSSAQAGQAPWVPPHRHFLVQPDGSLLPIGPQVCEDPGLQTAFNQFHASIHVGTVGTFAMDHSHNPVDITAGHC